MTFKTTEADMAREHDFETVMAGLEARAAAEVDDLIGHDPLAAWKAIRRHREAFLEDVSGREALLLLASIEDIETRTMSYLLGNPTGLAAMAITMLDNCVRERLHGLSGRTQAQLLSERFLPAAGRIVELIGKARANDPPEGRVWYGNAKAALDRFSACEGTEKDLETLMLSSNAISHFEHSPNDVALHEKAGITPDDVRLAVVEFAVFRDFKLRGTLDKASMVDAVNGRREAEAR